MEPDGVAVLAEAVRLGVRVVWDAHPPRFQGPTNVLAKEYSTTAREVLRRATTFRVQLGTWIQSGHTGVPILALPDAPAPVLGRCISCGTAIAESAWRCAICVLAVELVLELTPVRVEEPS